ncbi:phenylacetate--CoA ligase family protein [bacterium]|nr:phenylacetate--CoA ligase family protein [bacterium]
MNQLLPQDHDNPKRLLERLHSEPEERWLERGQKMALALFHDMARRVPAYKDFLKKNSVDPDSIKTMSDFEKVPTVDKDNYLRKYSRAELCWDGKFADGGQWVISTTSGSTGEPFYFPRQDLQDSQYALTAELYLLQNFQIDKKSTLYIDAFAMGAWIGGLFTYEAVKRVADRGKYNLSIITPGLIKPEVLNAVKAMGKDFDQVIIGCYPPVLKDIIDDGIEAGINWSDYNLGFIFSAEGFNESFRDYMVKNGHLKDVYRDTLNHYGTVDLGTMSHETPLAILVRRLAVAQPDFYREIFGQITKLPTLTQYTPEMFYFEVIGDNIACSCRGGLPLVRYDLKDHGGVMTLADVRSRAEKSGLNWEAEIRKANIEDTIWNLPFVYLYERSDFSVTLSGAQIYPETIRKALNDPSLERDLTGKFTMLVEFNENSDPVLEINLELKQNHEESEGLLQDAKRIIHNLLIEENSEYAILHEKSPDKIVPTIVAWPYEDPKYFRSGGKQKWIKK